MRHDGGAQFIKKMVATRLKFVVPVSIAELIITGELSLFLCVLLDFCSDLFSELVSCQLPAASTEDGAEVS